MRSKADVSTPRTIRRQQLREIVPLADSTIYEMEQRGEFPRRFALSPRCVGCGRVSATPERAHGSTQLLHTGRRISAVCRLGDHSYVVGSRSMPPVTSVDATSSRGRRGGGCLPDNSREISEGSTFSNAREVIMTMSEYEERFRPPAPSLHQTFAEVRGPNRGGRRSRRLWVTAALVGVMTITSKAALHHSSHADGSQVSKSGIQACDFIHR
jgi:predicted DNA-binding transcriptional regulator AlpA